jgi:hypothetical protein
LIRHRREAQTEGVAVFWLCGGIFGLVGGAFVAAGLVFEPMFALVGAPFVLLGLLIVGMMVAGLWVRRRRPADYEAWLWWTNFAGGVAGAAMFAVPATLALPGLLLLGDMGGERLLLGGLFTVLGLATGAGTFFVGRAQYRARPRRPQGGDGIDVAY